MNVLVIEDDPSVRTLVRAVLEHNNNEVHLADNAEQGEQLALGDGHDIIILDLGLPDGNGLELCESLRKQNVETPILILSAKHETDVKVKGLNTGADDYLTKPFNTEELMARIEAITRRSRESFAKKQELYCGELYINLIERKFMVNDNDVSLTNNEFNLMVYLMRNKNRTISQDELAKNVWDIHFDTQTNYINVYISYLRKKIRAHTEVDYIETVRKKGFILRCEDKE